MRSNAAAPAAGFVYHRDVAAAGSAGLAMRDAIAPFRQNNNQIGDTPMSKGQSLQDPFLNALRRERVPVSIYLVNGIKLQGTIESFDQFVVLLRNTVSQMVYKHAISTVVPARNVRVGPGGGYVHSAEGGDGEGADETE